MADSGLTGVFTELLGETGHRAEERCSIEAPGPFCLIIFGASGDLAQRKIVPALYRLFRNGLLSEQHAVIGAARSELDDRSFCDLMAEAVSAALPQDFDRAAWKEFSSRLFYQKLDYGSAADYTGLKKKIVSVERRRSTGGNRIFYLAVPPTVYEQAIERLDAAGLSRPAAGYTHLVIEKPIGSDLDSARRLNEAIRPVFEERQVYRMDHYLAKETVQNILMFRFANAIFEPLWNRRYIDHIQITVSETVGIGHRAGYYEKAGVIRDMFQNHIFQLLALTAMEPPSVFESERVRDEKVKVFRSVRPFDLERLDEAVVAAQYDSGSDGTNRFAAYREEAGVDPGSATPTYCAMKVLIDNWRWNGVPFYLRSGKRLSAKTAEIAVCFRKVPHLMFSRTIDEEIEPNLLVMRIQPHEGIGITFQAKVPGAKVCLEPVVMDFSYEKVFTLDAYERVLLDCMQGDQMLFVRSDGVEATWSILTPMIRRIEEKQAGRALLRYAAGSKGPDEADTLLRRDGRSWRPLRG